MDNLINLFFSHSASLYGLCFDTVIFLALVDFVFNLFRFILNLANFRRV